MINKELIKKTLSIIKVNDDRESLPSEYMLQGKYLGLNGTLQVDQIFGKKEYYSLSKYISEVTRQTYYLLQVLRKINWIKNINKKEGLDEISTFYGIDIDYFFIKYCSVFDLIAGIYFEAFKEDLIKIKRFFKSYYSKGYCNFADLKCGVIEVKEIEQSNPELFKAIIQTDWYDDFKEVRKRIVHGKDYYGMCFGVYDNMVTFQVDTRKEKKIFIKELMFNNNVIYFDLYAGLYLSYLYSYLEDVAELIMNKMNIKIENQAYSGFPRLVKELFEKVLDSKDIAHK